MKMHDVLKIRRIKNCSHLPKLNGQNECYTTIDIDQHTTLGQYVGNEMTKQQYIDIYNGTRDEFSHLT